MHYRPQRRSVLFTTPGLVVAALAVGAAGGMSVSLAEILALIEKPHLLTAILLVGAFAGMAAEQYLSSMRKEAWRARNRSGWEKKGAGASIVAAPRLPTPAPVPPKQLDAADQLRIVMSSNFTIQPLLNKSEARLFKELDRVVIGCNPSWQVMAQVSLGEILRSKDTDAYRCINSKRVDLLLVDGGCQPRYAIEYQGGAHHQGAAAARDAVKKEALRRAGIGYYEVVAGQTTPAELRRLVEKLVEKPNVNQRPASLAQLCAPRVCPHKKRRPPSRSGLP